MFSIVLTLVSHGYFWVKGRQKGPKEIMLIFIPFGSLNCPFTSKVLQRNSYSSALNTVLLHGNL